MTKICSLKFEIVDEAIASILKMGGWDVDKLEKNEIEEQLRVYMEQYFFNPPDVDFTVLEVKITDPQKRITEYIEGVEKPSLKSGFPLF